MTSTRILVTGANGQLGQTLRQLAPGQKGMEFVFLDRSTLPIDQHSTLLNYLSLVKFDFCINTAAYTNVDLAETEQEQAYAINALSAEKLAFACRQNQVRLIHVSTDYVFNGNSAIPYRETDPPDPVNYYGYTKRKGEDLSLAVNPQTLILRTAWLYSPFGRNFVKTMLRLMRERDSVKVVNDQLGSPTYALDLAEAMIRIIRSGKWMPGIYHYSNSGKISWYEFAKAIGSLSGLSCPVDPIPTRAFPTPAKRPQYSVLDCHKILDEFGIAQRAWEARLEACLAELAPGH